MAKGTAINSEATRTTKIMLEILLLITFGYPHVQSTCPVWQGLSPPKPLMTCDGRNRTVEKARDLRGIFNMTGSEALHIIDVVNKNKEECWKLQRQKLVPILNIRYESAQFVNEANIAIRTANLMSDLLTQGICSGNVNHAYFFGNPTDFVNDNLLYSLVRNNVESSDNVAGSAIIFKKNEYKSKEYFAPYAYKEKGEDIVQVRDLSLTWGPLQTSFMEYVENITRPRSLLCQTSLFTPLKNNASAMKGRYYTHAKMEFSDGIWARPYFECYNSKSWILSYVSPFMTISYDSKKPSPVKFLGGVSIDVNLNKVDINQCDMDESQKFPLEVFAGTHHCKKASTKCVHLPGRGFAVGSYKCVCKEGFYFPILKAKHKYFNGTDIENDLRNSPQKNNLRGNYECLRCQEGCSSCVDDAPCLAAFNLPLRYSILSFTLVCILLTILIAWVVYSKRKLKVLKSACPKFLLIILLGAFMMYIELLVMFSRPNDTSCAARPWLWNIGFALMVGALLLKNWRVSQIFQIKSAKRIRITDEMLLRKFIPILAFYALYLATWTITSAPSAVEKTTKRQLKYYVCTEDWWDFSILIGNCLFMLWGVYLCYTIRKAPSAFNESKFISWSIYNISVVTALMRLMRAFLINETGADTSYLLEFLQLHLTVTVLLSLVFLPKMVRIMKGRGNESDVNTTALRNRSLYGGGSSTDTMQMAQENETLKAEIRKLYGEMEMLKLSKIHEVHRKMSRSFSLTNETEKIPRKPTIDESDRDNKPKSFSENKLESPKIELVSYI